MQGLQDEIGQFKDKNKIKREKRTTRTPNDILLYDDYAEIVIRNNKQKIVGITKIDKEDIDKVKDRKWCLHINGYPATRYNNSSQYLHRFILDNLEKTDMKKAVDHINLDKMDNRKSNLRFLTNYENLRHFKKQEANIIKMV